MKPTTPPIDHSTRAARIRLYTTLRTTHLERAQTQRPATIFYRDRRYDFHENAAIGLTLRQSSSWSFVAELARSHCVEIEINEPLMMSSLVRSTVAIIVLKTAAIFRGHRVKVVTYAIENHNPFTKQSAKTRLKTLLLSRFVWHNINRIAYGTQASKSLYEKLFPPRRKQEKTLILGLASPCISEEHRKIPSSLIFLGAFTERKGFHLVAKALPILIERLPNLHVTLIGVGPLQNLALDAAKHDSVTTIIDPPRSMIHEKLSISHVSVLASTSQKEQIGLPLIEALSHGCTVVTTDETGIASWLTENGHTVISSLKNENELAESLIKTLLNPIDAEKVIASLPSHDGRLEADDWLFREGTHNE